MSTRPSRFLPHVLALATLGVLGVLGTGASASAAPAPPQLSISVDDGQADARSGATLRYAVTVTNLGPRPVRDLAVSQTVPPRTKPGPVADGGTVGKGAVRWTIDVPPGKSVTLKTSLAVGTGLPPELLRLATVACAATSAKAAPTVCASDSDQLPAGAAAAQQQRDVQDAAVTAARPAWLLPTGLAAGAVLVVGALAGTWVVLRRRGAAPAHPTV